VSHPAKQGSVYQWPLAAQRAGIPVKFLTGLYYQPERFPYSLVRLLPAASRASVIEKLERRYLPELDPRNVISVSGPWFEALFRSGRHFGAWNLAHDWLASRWLRRRYSPVGPAILHCFQGTFYHTIRAARRKGMLTVMEISYPPSTYRLLAEECRRHDLPSGPTSPPPEFFASLREVDYVVAQSRFSVESLLEYGVEPGRIILQPMGVDTDYFYPRSSKTPALKPFRVLFVGQIDYRKGLHHLLEAWTQLNLPDAELRLVGMPVNQSGYALLEKYKGAYRWSGYLPGPELAETYRQSDVFVLPSLAEGGSNVVYEALASGLSCVVSANAGSAVRDEVEGFVIPVGDLNALKDRITRLYQNPALRQQMAWAARQQAERYSWWQFSRRLRLMYEYLLSGQQQNGCTVFDMTNC
jgi:glycosyltransferase involved in cell wall biosynthesis